MRNREDFEGRVYELYELKKKKRAGTIKKFTVVATTLVAAACIVLVFTRFNREVKNPPTQGETFEENATMVGVDDATNSSGDLEMGLPQNGIPENDEMDGFEENAPETVAIGCINSITLYPDNTEALVTEDDSQVFYVRLYNAEVEEVKDYECPEKYYLFGGEDDKGQLVFIYSEGHIKVQNGEWMKLDESTENYIEKIIKELFG